MQQMSEQGGQGVIISVFCLCCPSLAQVMILQASSVLFYGSYGSTWGSERCCCPVRFCLLLSFCLVMWHCCSAKPISQPAFMWSKRNIVFGPCSGAYLCFPFHQISWAPQLLFILFSLSLCHFDLAHFLAIHSVGRQVVVFLFWGSDVTTYIAGHIVQSVPYGMLHGNKKV